MEINHYNTRAIAKGEENVELSVMLTSIQLKKILNTGAIGGDKLPQHTR
jgi:hypothetical protein